MPASPDASIAVLAERQHGAVAVEQLRGIGLAHTDVAYRVQTGRLHRVHRGVYAVGHPRLSREGRFLAAVLAVGPGAVLSHRSAAVLWGLVSDVGGPVDITVSGTQHPRRGILVHRTNGLRRVERTRSAGVPVTSPARTLFDLAATPTDDRTLRRAVREALVQRRVDERGLRAQLEHARGRRGAARIGAIIQLGPVATRSELEDRTLQVLEARGLPRPLVNAPVRIGSRTFEVDFLFEDRRLIIEADGAQFHDTVVSRQDDAARQAVLEAAGYRVVRVTWGQVTRETAQTVRRVRSAYAAQGAAALDGHRADGDRTPREARNRTYYE